jgi:hypothetical protein
MSLAPLLRLSAAVMCGARRVLEVESEVAGEPWDPFHSSGCSRAIQPASKQGLRLGRGQRHGAHTWNHLLLAEFYDQRISGQRSVNNASIYQTALKTKKNGGSKPTILPTIWDHPEGSNPFNKLVSCPHLLPPTTTMGKKEQEAPRGWRFLELSLSFFSQRWRGIGRKQGRKRSRREDAPTCGLILGLKFSRIACHVSKPKLTCFSRAPPLPGHAPDPQAPHRVVYVERVSNGSRFRARFRGLHLRSDYKGQGCSS